MNRFINIIFTFGLFFFFSCAAIQSPSGGPKDEIPPEVVKITPPDKSINFKGGEIKITFSEFIEESSIYKSIKVFPKPSNPITISLKNPSVIIELNDSLIKDQTYIISINRNLIDEHKVKIKQEVQLAFSTGEKIDHGSIKGKVYHSSLASVGLWKINKINEDGKMFFKRVPDYVIDASDNGEFQFNFLSNGLYRIISVDKSISGLPIDEGKMIYGLSDQNLIEINDLDSLRDIKIKIPKVGGNNKMIKAEYIAGGWGRLIFSEELNNWENAISILVHDDDLQLLSPKLFKDPLDDYTLNFMLDLKNPGYVDIKTIQLKNSALSTLDSNRIRLEIKNQIDSINIEVVSPHSKFIHEVKSDVIEPLEIIFSSLIQQNFNENSIWLKRDSINIPIVVDQNSYMSIIVTPEINWEENSLYELSIGKNFIKPLYSSSLKDSLYITSFKTSKFKKFGNFIGDLQNITDSIMVIELSSLDNISKKFQTNVNLDGSFKMLKVPEGDYSIQVYADIDRNYKFSHGTLNPYKPAEWFETYPDTINIRGNWDLEMKNIKVNYLK
ncbi:MAG: Ig-like domain-containing protein [Candidatus Neomarinimicrobiota bacterium]